MLLPKEKMDAACGTLSYVAPEVLTMQGYGQEADLWSVGVILFLVLCGKVSISIQHLSPCLSLLTDSLLFSSPAPFRWTDPR